MEFGTIFFREIDLFFNFLTHPVLNKQKPREYFDMQCFLLYICLGIFVPWFIYIPYAQNQSHPLWKLNENPDIFAKVSYDPSYGKIHGVQTKNWRQHRMTITVDTKKFTYLFMTRGTPSKHFVFALVSSSSSSCDGRTKLFRIMFFTKDFHDCTSSVVVNFISRQFFGWYIIPLVLSKFLVALLFFYHYYFFIISLPNG